MELLWVNYLYPLSASTIYQVLREKQHGIEQSARHGQWAGNEEYSVFTTNVAVSDGVQAPKLTATSMAVNHIHFFFINSTD